MAKLVEEIRTQESNQYLIEHLERMLKQAKTGLAQGMVSIVIYENGGTCYGWLKPPKEYHTTLTSSRMLGEIERLKYELLSSGRWVERDEIFG